MLCGVGGLLCPFPTVAYNCLILTCLCSYLVIKTMGMILLKRILQAPAWCVIIILLSVWGAPVALWAQTDDPTGTNAIIATLGQSSGSGAKVEVKQPDFDKKKLPVSQQSKPANNATTASEPHDTSAQTMADGTPIGATGVQLNASNAVHATGYRLQIYTGNVATSKKDAHNRATMVQARYPGLSTYVEYQAPFWKVLVGNYTSKVQATQDMHLLQAAFPAFSREIYVVRSKIFIAR